MADWYYIGHYGQLGPLTRDQIDELIGGGVIVRETYVWHSGMADWVPADSIHELRDCFALSQPFSAPPPPPGPGASFAPSPPPTLTPSMNLPYGSSAYGPAYSNPYGALSTVRSDRSRVLAGVLQLFLPGVGRIYLGYAAIGVLQLVLTLITCGLMWLWPFIDGILMLAGIPKLDGYGRVLGG